MRFDYINEAKTNGCEDFLNKETTPISDHIGRILCMVDDGNIDGCSQNNTAESLRLTLSGLCS